MYLFESKTIILFIFCMLVFILRNVAVLWSVVELLYLFVSQEFKHWGIFGGSQPRLQWCRTHWLVTMRSAHAHINIHRTARNICYIKEMKWLIVIKTNDCSELLKTARFDNIKTGYFYCISSSILKCFYLYLYKITKPNLCQCRWCDSGVCSRLSLWTSFWTLCFYLKQPWLNDTNMQIKWY